MPNIRKNRAVSLEGIRRATKRLTRHTTAGTQGRVKTIKEQVVGSTAPAAQAPTAPRITEDTLAKHRQSVLARARRFKYPLRPKSKVVRTSISIAMALVLVTVVASAVILYGFKSSGAFAYSLSKILPFPVARVDGSFVQYEKYLFEVRHNLFYLANHGQEGVDVDTAEGQGLVLSTKQRSMDKVLLDKRAEQLAGRNKIEVTDEEIEREIELFKARGGIDESEGALETILVRYYDWDLGDLRRVVKIQLIYQKLLPVLDSAAATKVGQIMSELGAGADFEALVQKYSEDPASKENDGHWGSIGSQSLDWTDDIITALFGLEVGQISEPLASPAAWHIFKVTAKTETEVTVSQIQINFFDLQAYLKQDLEKTAYDVYLRID